LSPSQADIVAVAGSATKSPKAGVVELSDTYHPVTQTLSVSQVIDIFTVVEFV
jgi:hypothetical protein